MSTTTIKGLLGEIEITHWYTGGDDYRINVYNEEGNSVFFVVKNRTSTEWVEALNLDSGTSNKLVEGRGIVEVTRVAGVYLVEAWDVYNPSSRTKAFFNQAQIQQIITALQAHKQPARG